MELTCGMGREVKVPRRRKKDRNGEGRRKGRKGEGGEGRRGLKRQGVGREVGIGNEKGIKWENWEWLERLEGVGSEERLTIRIRWL